MTNFILSTFTAVIMAVSFSLVGGEAETTVSSQLTEERQIELYEQVMDGCLVTQE